MSEGELADWEQGVCTVLLNTTPAKREGGLSSLPARRGALENQGIINDEQRHAI